MSSSFCKMIDEFICPGCMHGPDTKSCPEYKEDKDVGGVQGSIGYTCANHCPGTRIMGIGKIFLRMPVGFNKMRENKIQITVWEKGQLPLWDQFNVPVWAMEKDGYLFVRVFSPRTSNNRIEVIEGGTMELLKDFPSVYDVSKFIDQID